MRSPGGIGGIGGIVNNAVAKLILTMVSGFSSTNKNIRGIRKDESRMTVACSWQILEAAVGFVVHAKHLHHVG